MNSLENLPIAKRPTPLGPPALLAMLDRRPSFQDAGVSNMEAATMIQILDPELGPEVPWLALGLLPGVQLSQAVSCVATPTKTNLVTSFAEGSTAYPEYVAECMGLTAEDRHRIRPSITVNSKCTHI